MGRTEQLEELDALESIFYSQELQIIKKDGKDIRVVFLAHVTLPENFTVKYKESPEAEEYSSVEINYLPPVRLNLTLPESYPSKCSPKFTISCQWLTKPTISRLCTQLEKIWHENENVQIIYMWIDFLKNDLLDFLGIENELDLTELYSLHMNYIKNSEQTLQYSNKQGCDKPESNSNLGSKGIEMRASVQNNDMYKDKSYNSLFYKNDGKTFMYSKDVYYNSKCTGRELEDGNDCKIQNDCDPRACLDLNLQTSPLKIVINYNAERKKLEFNRTFFTCNICFTTALGIDCTMFENCNHVFCNNCVSSYFTIQINDGAVNQIKCLESKCSSDATPMQVKNIVSPEVFAKYDSLLLQSVLDALDNVIYCPRKICQYPATRDADENFAICPNCQYVFCIFCRMVYHGIEPCRLKSEEKRMLVDKYVNASPEVKAEMELRYGLKHLQTLVNDSLAETWIDSNCKNCPHCNVSIEKSYGCNRMICWKCGTYFCWLCSATLDPADPYFHFNNASSRCANKLFYLTPLGEEELDDYNSDDEQWRDWDWI
ncbi:UNVERIFIED_CONTAM: hypothetical protein PYX00_009624 [Menopon gallinae]|uniref:RBR-type E3 ubiquitin transferase n=1 Tax=Menopon gallinae TaxID=328185 RepID=A0AAW2HCC8_9NEOP